MSATVVKSTRECKYWSSKKEIHEKHITQLYGTMASYCIEHNCPKENVKGVLITNIQLSPMAKKMAKYLGIKFKENIEVDDYPCIKCNIGRDMYAKDISKKIRSVLKEKQKNGEYMCSIPAYGYKRHPTIKNKLIVDEQVRYVVEKIFDMYANEHGSVEIVNYLNNNHFLSPTGYRKTGLIQDKNKKGYNWNEVTLCNMLKNEVYIGNTIQNKRSIISYKVKK